MDILPAIAKGLMLYKTDGFRPKFYYNSSSALVPNWNLLAIGDTIRWNGIQNPIKNKSIDHVAFFTTFTFDGATEVAPFRMSSNSPTKI